MRLFAFKKLSWKIAFIVLATVVIVGGSLVAYMQSRTMLRISQLSKTELQLKIQDMADECDLAFVDATYKIASLKNFVEANFDVEKYMNDPENYFENEIISVMNGFVYNTVENSDFVDGAYFIVHPDLTGEPYIHEVSFEKLDGRVLQSEPGEYEDYLDVDSEDMEWYYGAYGSGKPYWTQVYEWEIPSGIGYWVTYAEPVFIGSEKIGIVGVDMPITHLADLIKDIDIYDNGFALLEDAHDEFIATNDFITGLGEKEKERLADTAHAKSGEVFEIKLGGNNFIVVQTHLENDYDLFLLVPKSEFNAESAAAMRRLFILFPFVTAAVLIVSYFVGRTISNPFITITGVVDQMAQGELHTSVLDPIMKLPDETGTLARAVRKLRIRLGNLTDEIKMIADGDLTGQVKIEFEGDAIGTALDNTLKNLNNMFARIHSGMMQVTSGSRQIADNSQDLAQGSSEQSAVIEELSASITDIKDKIGRDADTAREASELSSEIRRNAEKGNAQMDQMMQAVRDIDEASKRIEKVIKVIDDIAFQTNILALNAAVEAARAGMAGKGFAVVAEEVRNLAAKSADAAKDTGELISGTVEKAHLGLDIATETATSLKEIVNGINHSAEMVARIALSSDEQATAIEGLNTGIKQVANVVQQNSAAAQESAAASEEMSGQADMVEALITQFKLKEGVGKY